MMMYNCVMIVGVVFVMTLMLMELYFCEECRPFTNITIEVVPKEPVFNKRSWIRCIVDDKEDFCGEPITLVHTRDNVTRYTVELTHWKCEAPRHEGYHTVFGECDWMSRTVYGLVTTASYTHDGTWSCRYNNTLHSSTQIKVIFRPSATDLEPYSSRPIIWEHYASNPTIIVENNQDLVITCTGDGPDTLKPLIYSWARREGRMTVRPARIGEESKLVFPSIKRTDGGFYDCIKRNKAGDDRREIIVKVYCKLNTTGKLVPCEEPPKLYHPSSTLTRKPYIGGKAEFKIFYHQLNPKDTVDIKCKNNQRSVVNSCRFGTKRVVRKMPTNWGKRGETRYYYGQWRIQIWNVKWDDYGIYRCWLKNTTNGLETYFNMRLISPAWQSRIKDLQVLSFSSESAKLSWVSLSSKENQYFMVDYRLAGASNWKTSIVSAVDSSSVRRHLTVRAETELTGLSPHSEYEIRVKDWSRQSNDDSVTAPSGTITVTTKGNKSSSAFIPKFIESVVIFQSADKVTVDLAEPVPLRDDVIVSVQVCSPNTTAATPGCCRSFNFSSLIGQIQARIDHNALYKYTVRLVDDGDVIYSRSVIAILVEEGAFQSIDGDVILIVCTSVAILLFVALFIIVNGRQIIGTFRRSKFIST
ncbi:uncharacterized protein LOC141904114 [Tubulanus polymorphus]|uniref:uncharacterized protein LOC141904114 n=1 Tax=Tubulanus polymorphus TaxID=672921 RepID=UPI003DA25A18